VSGDTEPAAPERSGRWAALDPRLRLLVLAGGVLVLLVLMATSGSLSSAKIQERVDDLGWIGPVIFIPLSALLTVACFPGPLLAGAAGLIFGTAVGTPVAICSATLGASLAFLVSRRVGADALDELTHHRISKLKAIVERRGFMSVLYARIAPGMPYNLVNYAAGLTRIPLRTFAGATAIGCAPRAFAYAALGGSLDDLGSPEAIVAFCVLVGMALLGGVLLGRDVLRGRAARA
jgi:uncharacterized membrane protein YdjX (TVP38/TMEM64 family)